MAAQYHSGQQRHQGPPPQQHQHGSEHDNPPGSRSHGNQQHMDRQSQYDNQQVLGQQHPHQTGVDYQPSQYVLRQQSAPPVPRLHLPRSISSTNLEKTSQCRSAIQQDWVIQAPPGGTNFFATVPIFTLTLPNLDSYPPDFQQFVFDRLIDKGVQQNLEQEKCLNWCRSATRLVPLITTGDGNCLLHSASLSMWGFQDRNFALRRAVHTALANSSSTQLHRRWKHSRGIENLQMGIELEDHQWDKEWRIVVSQASLDTRHGQPSESLDDFHIFVLANVLRRPIIMYAASKIRSKATGGTLQQINFHGIYLPLIWEPSSCKKDPLPLAYIGGHFVALVAIEHRSEYSQGMFTLPLTDVHDEMLPVRFALSMEEPLALIMDYLRTTKISFVGDPLKRNKIVCAQLSIAERPSYLKPLLSGFIDACREAYQPQRSPFPPSLTPTASYLNNCGLYGDPEKSGVGSYHKQLQTPKNEEDMFYSKQLIPRTKPLKPKLTQDSQSFWAVERAEIYMTEQEVGRGAWGVIKIAEFRGQRVAAKVLHSEIISPNNIRLFNREMNMSARVHHPNIVHFFGATKEGTPIILMELMSTSLRHQLATAPLTQKEFLSIASDIVKALNYLHLMQPKPIIHRDVSSANVLLDPLVSPMTWKAKLSDFGSTNFVSNQATTGPGNPLYAAPEAFSPYQQTPKMDVFSFGIVLIEACTREMPSIEDREELIGKIAWVQVVPLIHRCIEMNQDKRPTMDAVLRELSQLQRTA